MIVLYDISFLLLPACRKKLDPHATFRPRRLESTTLSKRLAAGRNSTLRGTKGVARKGV